MLRFLLAMLVASSALHASSFAFSSCTAGTTTVSPCPDDFTLTSGLSGPNYFVSAFAGTSEFIAAPDAIVPGSPGGQELSAVANAAAEEDAPPDITLSATANASDSVTYSTNGPSRSGFIQFAVALGYLHQDAPGAASALLTDGVHQYSYSGGGGIYGSTPPLHCFIEDCEYEATVPFDLGSEFQVSVSANAAVAVSSAPGSSRGHDDDSQVVFRLLESDGATPVPFSVTPEPSTWGLLLCGLAIGACLVPRKRLRS